MFNSKVSNWTLKIKFFKHPGRKKSHLQKKKVKLPSDFSTALFTVQTSWKSLQNLEIKFDSRMLDLSNLS